MRERTGQTVGEAMTSHVITVSADAPLAEAAKLLDEHGISGAPVVDARGHLVGVFSQTDLVRARVMEQLWADWSGLAVRHFMSAPPVVVRTSTSLDEAADLMEGKRIHRLVVVGPDQRTPIGILSATDLVHVMAEAAPAGQVTVE